VKYFRSILIRPKSFKDVSKIDFGGAAIQRICYTTFNLSVVMVPYKGFMLYLLGT